MQEGGLCVRVDEMWITFRAGFVSLFKIFFAEKIYTLIVDKFLILSLFSLFINGLVCCF